MIVTKDKKDLLVTIDELKRSEKKLLSYLLWEIYMKDIKR